MLRVVIDANIFVSTLLGGKITPKVTEGLFVEKFKLVYSKYLFDELKNVITRPEFEFESAEINRILTFILAKAEFWEPKEKISACRDSKDNPVLECGIAGKVDFIVTGDKDLLELKTFRNISIITPRDFLKHI